VVIVINKLEGLLEEEKYIRFESFDENKALKLGLKILTNAKRIGNVSIQILRNDQLLFYYSMSGTSIDNQNWCRKKSNVVKMFSHSSLYIKEKYLQRNQDFNNCLKLDSSIYQAKGGSVPLLLKDTGLIGSVTVSGLSDEDDHKLVIESIKEFIKEEES